MKIAFVTHTAYPDFIGGREHHVHNLATALAECAQVTVIAGSGSTRFRKTVMGKYTLIILPSCAVTLSRNPRQVYRITQGLYKTLRAVKPDIVHAFEYGSYSTGAAYLFSLFKKIPFFITVYGYQLNSMALKIMYTVYGMIFGKRMLMHADKIFCPSPQQFNELTSILGKHRDGKITIQRNSIQVKEFDSALNPEIVPASYRSFEGVKMLTAARILPRKGVENTLYALKRVIQQYAISDIKFFIAGPDCGERGRLQLLAGQLGVGSHVVFLGPLPYRDMRMYYQHCDIFVLSSLYEGSPLALLEAMASGKAVIFSGLPGADTIISNNKTGILVKPGDVMSLAAAVAHLCRDKTMREHLGANARKAVRYFDSGVEASAMKTIYTASLRASVRRERTVALSL